MSSVKCEYCESVFEYTGQTSCPCCGGSLSGNKDVEKILARQGANQEMVYDAIRNVSQRIQQKQAQTHDITKIFVIIIIVIASLVILTAIFGMLTSIFAFGSFGGIFTRLFG